MGNQYLVRNTGIAADLPGGKLLVMSPVDSCFLTLSEVAAKIWHAADGRTRLSDIVEQRICTEFEVDSAQARRDAGEIVKELSRLGVLGVSPHPLDRAMQQTSLRPGTPAALRQRADDCGLSGARGGAFRSSSCPDVIQSP